MLRKIWATVRQGKIELVESVNLPKGAKVKVTLLANDETEFWIQSSQMALDVVWDNSDDDVYAQLQAQI